jgi:transposase-like protein
MSFKSLFEMLENFSDEKKCIEHFTRLRFRNGAFCPHCDSKRKVHHFLDGKRHKCADCRQQFTIRIGTIFEDSRIPLKKWFVALYLVSGHKKGISSYQLAKDIKVTQKTAWFMLQRIQFASQTNSFNKLLNGNIEVDETYVGGKERNKHLYKRFKGAQGRSTKTKTSVIGIIKRGSELRMQSTLDNRIENIKPIVVNNISKDATIYTDEAKMYSNLSKEYKHKTVNHGIGEYVNQDSHTNTIEGAFSHFKRMIIGIYHHISEKHMDRYADMFCFRFNTRKLSEMERIWNLLKGTDKKLSYKSLIA